MRRNNDFYSTPEWATRLLIAEVPVGGNVLECCVGDGAISKVLPEASRPSTVFTNDIDISRPADYHEDASSEQLWKFLRMSVAWVVTNPPFNSAPEIVPRAYERADEGIAMLLRLSYLKPCKDRGPWLTAHPVSALIILPRISFTGDGKIDNVTCAWMVWDKGDNRQRVVVVKNPKFEGLYQ